MRGLIEYQRNLKNNINLIEEENNDFDFSNKIMSINIDQFIKKNPSLRERFGKKSVSLNIGNKIKVKILKYYVKLNNEVIFVCDLDNEDFDMI